MRFKAHVNAKQHISEPKTGAKLQDKKYSENEYVFFSV